MTNTLRKDARLVKLLKNIFGSAAARAVNLFITLALVPLTINALSITDYAFFAMAISLSVLAAYADLGMGLAVVNVVAERGSKPTSSRAQRAVSVVWFSLLAIAGAGMLIISILVAWVNFGLQSELTHQYNAMMLAAGCVFAGLPTGLVQRVLFAEQKNIQANAWSTGSRIVSLGVVWVLVTTNHANLLALIFAVLGVPMLIGWLSVVVVFGKKHIEDLRPKWICYDFRMLRPYMVFGSSFLVLQTVPYIETGMDSLLIGNLIDINLVLTFDVYLKLFTYVPALISISIFPIWPAIANAKASGDVAWVFRVRKWGYLAIFVVSLTISSLLIFYSSEIVNLWIEKRLTVDFSVLLGLSLFCVLSSIGLFQSMFLNGIGKIKEQVIIYFIYLLLLLVAKISMAFYFGLTAMVWSLNIFYLLRLFLAEKLIKADSLSST